MNLKIKERILLPKFTLTYGEDYSPNYLTPRDTWILVLDDHAEYDYDRLIQIFPDHIIVQPMTIYTPFSRDDQISALNEYISIYTDENGVVDLSGIHFEPDADNQTLIETIESDWFYASGKKVRYPDGRIVQL